MGRHTIKLGILTSSRADYGIYLPLLKTLETDDLFKTDLLVFGTHLSRKYGSTVKQIESDGFMIVHRIHTAVRNDRPEDIVRSIVKTQKGFSCIWTKESYDLVVALGDRYEMFAAVSSTVPFNIPVAHIHGGETTLGSLDNVFRHSITCMARLHFTTCEAYQNRVIEIVGSESNVFNVGALSIDNLNGMNFFTIKEFRQKYGIDLETPTILFTYHPDTISCDSNIRDVEILHHSLNELSEKYQIIISMPNSDTYSNLIRNKLEIIISGNPRIFGIESFGSRGYLSCMKHCTLMLGNTSSGFVEASWFPKPVINLGDRQKGRILTPNIISCPVDKMKIIEAVSYFESHDIQKFECIYGDGAASQKITKHIKEFTNKHEGL